METETFHMLESACGHGFEGPSEFFEGHIEGIVFHRLGSSLERIEKNLDLSQISAYVSVQA